MVVPASADGRNSMESLDVRLSERTMDRNVPISRLTSFRDGPLELKLQVFLPLSEAEKSLLGDLQRTKVDLRPGVELMREGEPIAKILIVTEGWAIRHRDLSDGRRQIINFVLPGDFVGVQSVLFAQSDHSVSALTKVKAAHFEPDRIIEMFARFPRLAAALSWCTTREESIIAERVASIGRRSAYERMAHLFLELLYRLRTIKSAPDKSFELPVTQEVLADVLGLSIVHVNRTLRRLRQEGLIELDGGRIVIPDIAALEKTADFEKHFLHAGPPPRRVERQLEALENGAVLT